MEKTMTAVQAKRVTEETLTSVVSGPIMEEIKQQIEAAARRGEFAIMFDLQAKLGETPYVVSSNVTSEIVKKLKQDGFKVQYFSDQYDTTNYYTISWN